MATISRDLLRKHYKVDLIAGLTVAILVIPQAMGYAQLAGVPPILGLYTSFIPLLIYPLFGSSPHVIVGCAAIPSMMVFSSISTLSTPFSDEYVALAAMLTFLVGVCLIVFRLLQFGLLAKLVSRPVIYGYTAGAALLVLFSQFRYILKVKESHTTNNLEYFAQLFEKISDIHPLTMVVGLIALIFLLIIRKINKKIPSALLILFLSILFVYIFKLEDFGLELVGNIPAGLPSIAVPFLEWEKVFLLLPHAVIIALVAYVQSFAIAKTFAMHGTDESINPDKELFAVGAANLVSSFFSCFPNTGSLTKSAVNHDAGSKTGFSSLVAGAIVGFVLLFFTRLFYFLPKAILAAIIVVAVLKFIDLKGIKKVLNFSRIDFAILISTLLLTFFINIQVGVITGLILSLLKLLFQRKTLRAFFQLFRDSNPYGSVDGTVISILKPIVYINADDAYKNLKKQILDSGSTQIKFYTEDIDMDGMQTLERLHEELGISLVTE